MIQYVNRTLDYHITYRRGADVKPIRYVDSDYGGDLDTCWSTKDYMFTIAGGAVSWSSKCQQTISLSMTEAEYMALTCGTQQAMWIFDWLMEVDLH